MATSLALTCIPAPAPTSKLIVSSADWLRVKEPPAFAKPLPPVKVISASLITGAAPLEAVVILPKASTVIEARV